MIQSDKNNLLVAAPFPPNCRNGLAKSTSGTAAPPKPCPSGKHWNGTANMETTLGNTHHKKL